MGGHAAISHGPDYDPFQSLVGTKVTSVVFVMNYLQLVFDDKILTYNVWPEIENGGRIERLGDLGYEHSFRLLIGHKLEGVGAARSAGLSLTIGDSTVAI